MERPPKTTIADLEIYGLSLRVINGLENQLGAIYVDDLKGVTVDDLRARSRFGSVFGRAGIMEIQAALRNFLAGTPVRTPKECIVMRGRDDD